MLKFYTFLNIYLISCNQYNYTHTKPIIGENVRQARDNEFPFVVSLMRINTNLNLPEQNHICTGSLISNKDVLTAEHCLENEQQFGLVILLGSINLRLCTRYYIFWWKTFNNWSEIRHYVLEFLINDIAIIRVPDTIAPGVITNLSDSMFYGLESEIAGWGVTNTGVNPKILRTANLIVLSNDECEKIILGLVGEVHHVDKRFFCSRTHPYVQIRKGDSGGPIIHMGKIIGINKSIIPFPHIEFHPEKVNIHIGMEFYRSFIFDVKRNF